MEAGASDEGDHSSSKAFGRAVFDRGQMLEPQEPLHQRSQQETTTLSKTKLVSCTSSLMLEG